jgi:hypothetical protein
MHVCRVWIASSVASVLWLAACGGDSARGSFIVPQDGGGQVTDGAVMLPEGCAEIEPTYADYAEPFFAELCVSCHSASQSGEARLGAPDDVNFDSEADIAFAQARIQRRVIDERAMPPGAPLSDCRAAQLASYLQSLGGEGACEPACTGKSCGPDGCGGSCGTCVSGEMCGSTGVCVAEGCVPACEGVACGDDGCGGVCGTCGPGLGCDASGRCVCAPQCDGSSCGDDGCGGVCGECSAADVCGVAGDCVCIPGCNGAQCGDDGCGGSCGSCAAGDSCVAGACECVPDCAGRNCGPDGCGGDCGSCTQPGRMACNTTQGRCVAMCTGDCSGRECGDDGCGGSCGPDCGEGQFCSSARQCECAPDCVGKACGDDGCGGSCGSCVDELTCDAGRCGCTPSCDGRECGSDGCGGSCGTCAGGLSCGAGRCVAQCVPNCSGKACGDDGCGGGCGGCGAAQSCDAGACVAAEVTFDTVFAIFQRSSCGTSACHGGARPQAGLDLSSASVAQADLVGVTAEQCTGKKLVLPGDPAQSYLINKLTGVGMCSGSQMPKGKPALSAADIDTIRAWISGL